VMPGHGFAGEAREVTQSAMTAMSFGPTPRQACRWRSGGDTARYGRVWRSDFSSATATGWRCPCNGYAAASKRTA
jgi:hypothetical protein